MNLLLMRARKLLHAVSSASGRRALKFGIAASIEHKSALRGVEYRTIVDIGANVGQFALFARERYPKANIFSFEPLEYCWSKYNEIFRDDKHVQLFCCGIGPTDSEAALNVTNANDSSSILAPATMQAEVFGTKVTETKTVQLRRLSSVLTPDRITSPALLKIDVQGFELSVLCGCDELLSLFDAVYVESSYVELYKSQGLIGEVINFLQQRRFGLRGVFNQHVDPATGPLQADFMFQRTTDK
ncbi:FkbM family methyltransferase [Bradyrhizobium centrosematis]|uniref:FkbM family methyltransferase n=1 Tax=Bradyrhizobium centrosematis TaxID=1300039 RepID=UPI0021682B7C|nr:FkbM family methyltransferase [Bradyrhizobium centrosematis]MCS3765066.1 FkbM family methyltransferase [Bradyrhizobium centrosematis]MCS3777658.1 FkbM family methyltransferase [Bradyrhizobium centrosematis]